MPFDLLHIWVLQSRIKLWQRLAKIKTELILLPKISALSIAVNLPRIVASFTVNKVLVVRLSLTLTELLDSNGPDKIIPLLPINFPCTASLPDINPSPDTDRSPVDILSVSTPTDLITPSDVNPCFTASPPPIATSAATFKSCPISKLFPNKLFNSTSRDLAEILELDVPDTTNKALIIGDVFDIRVVLNINELSDTEIGTEIVITKVKDDGSREIDEIHELDITEKNNKIITYRKDILVRQSGVYEYGFRIFPKHPKLPHRQDFSLTKWI